MSAPDQANLRHLLAVCRGAKPDPSLPWATSLDQNLAAWRRGRPGSVNRARISNAIRCADDPDGAAEWWARMLAVEAGNAPQDEYSSFHNAAEPLSGIYWGWSWIAEIAAVRLLRRKQTSVCREVTYALQASIDRHTALASLVARSDVAVRPGKRVVYRGPVTLGPGARSDGRHEADNRTAHPVFAACLGIEPHAQQKGIVAELAVELAPEAFRKNASLCRQVGSLIGAPGLWGRVPPLRAAVQGLIDGPLSTCRLAAPFEFYFWEDGRRLGLMRRNCNGNTGAQYASHLPPGITESGQAEYLYPYGKEPRVRSKDLIGAGSCWGGPGVWPQVSAENMTRGEEAAKRRAGGNPRRYTDSLSRISTTPDAAVRIGPQGSSVTFS